MLNARGIALLQGLSRPQQTLAGWCCSWSQAAAAPPCTAACLRAHSGAPAASSAASGSSNWKAGRSRVAGGLLAAGSLAAWLAATSDRRPGPTEPQQSASASASPRGKEQGSTAGTKPQKQQQQQLLQDQMFLPPCCSKPYRFPTDKLKHDPRAAHPGRPVVLVSCGSFNPPTVMHMRMFDVAADELRQLGFDVWGGYVSPVADAYGKKGLAPACDRLAMCEAACVTSPSVMCDRWEVCRPGYTRTLAVLRHISEELQAWLAVVSQHPQGTHTSPTTSSNTTTSSNSPTNSNISTMNSPDSTGNSSMQARAHHSTSQTSHSSTQASKSSSEGTSSNTSQSHAPSRASTGAQQPLQAQRPQSPSSHPPRVMLLCGADVLLSMAQPGVWRDPDVLLQEHGVVCVAREGSHAALEAAMREEGGLLNRYRHCIVVVEDRVPNSLSSTRVRSEVAHGRSVKYLVPDGVADYLACHPELYAAPR